MAQKNHYFKYPVASTAFITRYELVAYGRFAEFQLCES
jgi:hypothetical protein